jgi:hypothetical protein
MFRNRRTRTRKDTIIVFFLIYFLIEQFTLTLWNPTVHPVVHYARIPVTIDYTVRDPTGQIILSEVIEEKNEKY